jgi:diamine N-acetyltransferase
VDLFDFEPLHRRIGLGILIADKNDRQKGYAAEALQLVLQYCVEFLECHQVYCHVETDNSASIKLFEKLGFQISGRRKDWVRHQGSYKD